MAYTVLKSVTGAALLGLIFTACSTTQPSVSSQSLNDVAFKSVDAPISDAQKRQILTSEEVTINGKSYKIGWHTIARTGQVLPSLDGKTTEIFGQIKNEAGVPINHKDGSPFVCKTSKDGSGPDHTTLHERNGQLYAITQFECGPGAMYISRLEKTADGGLKAVATSPISQADYYGGWVHCAGMKTPWGSHLGSEEYEPNARALAKDEYYFNFTLYFKEGEKALNPYYWGWMPEVTITSDKGDTKYVKHYAMGRFAHELGYVMPDEKTVYLTDDGVNGALFMFIADQPKDLSAGTLYSAKLEQKSDRNGGAFNLTWINLGHASDAQIRSYVDKKLSIDAMFEVAKDMNGKCPADFRSVNTSWGFECLKLKEGMEIAASRLEARRYAAYLGATTEFNKKEGITFNPKTNQLYIAISRVLYGMEDYKKSGEASDKYDQGGGNHIKLPRNDCGGVYRLDIVSGQKDANGASLASAMVATTFVGEVMGEMKTYPKGSDYEGNKCSVDAIAEPDNLTFIKNSNLLIIGEDTGLRQIDYMWAYNVETKKLTRIFTTPYGSETTSPFWYPNIGGNAYLTAVVQHPYGESDKDKKSSPQDIESWVGVVGPFPAFE
ncbi:PhoX family protein [Sulfurospirillum cavolei]|uniref:PhoX family protein n=1 Tax=Sulfurospirillum cavolei TaxID=366522 RepID=UPI0005A61768|nr:alkaline phosphatase PhoX [Sulfurospirillum cavolei]